MNRRESIFAAAALMAGGLPAARAGISATEIPIGCMLDLSGPTASSMGQLLYSTQLRIDEANAAGGVHGRKLRLIVEDNGGQPQQAVRVVQKLLRQDGVFAMLSNFGSGTNAATMKMIADAGVINFGPWASSSTVFKISGNSPLVFTYFMDYEAMSDIGLSWAIHEWKPKKIGLINMEGAFGELIKAGINKALKQANLTLAAEATYKPGEIDFSSQVARMKAADVDLIYCGTITRETIGVMSEVRKLDWKSVKVLTGNPGSTGSVAALGKETVEGLYGTQTWRMFPDNPASVPAVKNLFDGFKRLGAKVEPEDVAGSGYTIADWFVKILQAAGPKLDAQTFVKAAPTVPEETFSTLAKLQFNGNHAEPQLAVMTQVRGGKWVALTQPIGPKAT